MNRFLIILMGLGIATAVYAAEETQSSWELTGTFSVMNPNRLVLSSREYQVSYSKNFFGISAFQLGLSLPGSSWGQFQVFPFARAGYARNQGTYALTSPEGTGGLVDVTLHWVPLSGGIRTEYNIPGFDLIRPYFMLAGGAEWLTQRGNNPGINENFWIPFYNVGLGLSFADSAENNELGFGGFSFSINFQNGLRSDQEARLLSYDLTVHFLL